MNIFKANMSPKSFPSSLVQGHGHFSYWPLHHTLVACLLGVQKEREQEPRPDTPAVWLQANNNSFELECLSSYSEHMALSFVLLAYIKDMIY